MKKIIFILGLAAVVLGTSCSDVLDLNPADRFSPATVWSTTTTADKYVIGLYSIFGANTEMHPLTFIHGIMSLLGRFPNS